MYEKNKKQSKFFFQQFRVHKQSQQLTLKNYFNLLEKCCENSLKKFSHFVVFVVFVNVVCRLSFVGALRNNILQIRYL